MENKIFKLRCGIFCLLLNLCFCFQALSEPILRIEVGQHTAMINRMAIDKEEKLLATASDDKTVRLWNLPEGTLYTTLRVPIDTNFKGALYAVAISPDGKTVITSGETSDDERKFSIYVFDVEKRVLKARIPNLPSEINHLAYSKDGRNFAAAFAGGYGIKVWDSITGKLVASDTDYGDRCNWLDFNESGNLATASDDGYVRIYDKQSTLIKKSAINAKGKPYSISFSENGQSLAIGYANLLQVDITDIYLNKITTLTIDKLIGTKAAIVKWQNKSNSNILVAGDIQTEKGNYIIRNWQGIDSKNIRFQDVEVSKDIVTDILPLNNVENAKIDTLFASADPSWGALNNNNIIFINKANLWNARVIELSGKTFALSKDGLSIAFSQTNDTSEIAVFDTSRLTLQTKVNEDLLNTFTQAARESARFKISKWNRDVPQFNGKTLDFEKYEESLTLAINPKQDRFIIGTNYNLRFYNDYGVEVKKISVPSGVYGANISTDGKLAIVANGDGTIRWYSLVEGDELEELVTLFPYNNGKDWIVWTKEGFFGSSDGRGYRLAGYHINKGESNRPEWIEFSQIYQAYYAPELILPKLLNKKSIINGRLKSNENINQRFDNKAVPIIELTEYCINPQSNTIASLSQDPIQSSAQGIMRYYQQLKKSIKTFFNWIFSIFGSHDDANMTIVSSSLALQKTLACYPIVGQGQTRGFKRKEGAQNTVFRNQLDVNTGEIELHYKVNLREGGVGDVDIYVNGQIQQSQKYNMNAVETKELHMVQSVRLKDGDNEISVHAFEKSDGTAGISNTLALHNPVRSNSIENEDSIDRKRIIILAVGIDHYQPPNELRYAVKDSSDFIKTVIAKKSRDYRDVLSFPLFNEQATLENIESEFDKIQSLITVNDTVLIYLSGHGVRDDRDFYFIPYDANDENFEATALSQGNLKKNIAKLSKTNKIFVFVDSCHSGGVGLDIIQQEIASFDKIKQQLGENIFVLAAAGENQETMDQFKLENNQIADNGLFAYAVLEGLNGKAGRIDDKIVDSIGLGSYVQRRIDHLTKNQTLYKQKARFQLLEAGDFLDFGITQYE